jgi:hypothetical protein
MTTHASSAAALDDVRDACKRRLRDGTLPANRRALVDAVLASLDRVPALAVPASVKRLIADEFGFIANADEDAFARHVSGKARYERLVKIASLHRFPAGQFEWERSGISRSDVVRVGATALPRVGWFIARHMGGLKPVFFSHLNPRRTQRSLSEAEANHSYYRMARAMELQPDVLGFAACSWFRSPGTHRVSPHLAWTSSVFLENGGIVVEAGRDDPDSGVLARSATRRALYDAGRFTPTRGLVMWPRAAMIAWAHEHPELDE